MINLNNIDVIKNKKYILNNISLEIKKGDFISIIGSSGSGKTTLLNIIGLIEYPTKGSISINKVSKISNKQKQIYRKKIFGYVFQNFLLMDNCTIYENFKLIAPSKKVEDFKQALEKVDISPDKVYDKVYNLSGGEQQRVALARVLLKDFEVILADEPTGNLDDKNALKVLDILNSLKSEGKTIICVTHDEKIASKSDKIIKIRNGELL